MEAALRLLLPKVLGDLSFEIYPHQCKDELLLRLPHRLRGYGQRRKSDAWFRDHCRIVVVIDRDDDDCAGLKRRLEKMASEAGLATRASAKGSTYMVVNRLAIEELEACYFGDWEAVQAAYPGVSATIPSQAKYRAPDEIAGGTWEAFERVLQRAGYYSGGLRKVEAARTVAAHMAPSRNTSPSFCALREVLLEMVRA
ncbi:MAG: DUF4276 family protein [Betaproteobacteria bacterium]|nr:DUF4276 family protein [Betaproteobacteria bacterium]